MDDMDSDFDWMVYCTANRDLWNMDIRTEKKAVMHWVFHGKKENRTTVCHNFDWIRYKSFLEKNGQIIENRLDVLNHYFENKNKLSFNYFCEIYPTDIPFIPELYCREIDDSTLDCGDKLFEHFSNNRNNNYDQKIQKMRDMMIDRKDFNYWYMVKSFIDIKEYQLSNLTSLTAYKKIQESPQLEFKYYCFRYLNYIRNFTTPILKTSPIDETVASKTVASEAVASETVASETVASEAVASETVASEAVASETVLIDFQKLPHIEFLIKNTVISMPCWSHTILCCRDNYDHMVEITGKISQNIKIIVLDRPVEICDKFVQSDDFLKNIVGHRILVYRDCLFDFINIVGIFDRLKNNLSVTNELIEINIIKQTNRLIELIHSKDLQSINAVSWKKYLDERIVMRVAPRHNLFEYLDTFGHRGGWKWVMLNMMKNDFFDNNSDIKFFDMVDFYNVTDKQNALYYNQDTIGKKQKYVGMIHGTVGRKYKNIKETDTYCHLDSLLKINGRFIQSINSFNLLFTFSDHCRDYLNKKLEYYQNEGQINDVLTIYHPTTFECLQFDVEYFKNSKERMLIQLGQQLRYCSTIYLLKTNYQKIWLSGMTNRYHVINLLKDEIRDMNNTKTFPEIEMDSVKIMYIKDYKQYDELLGRSIVLIHLKDANANNSVIECIVRNIPFIVNRHPAVVEYLGANYPLYFDQTTHIDQIDQINRLLTDDNLIISAHHYLSKLDKTKIMFSTFANRFLTELHRSFAISTKIEK
jgi:hypothetical protein